MALIPTHIRFALDVKSEYPIKDKCKYIAGTVYPDSRWTTGQDRESTHGKEYLNRAFPFDDFTYGWHVHCICDAIQNEIFLKMYKGAMELSQIDRWILFSSAKVVQDMDDLTRFDLNSVLRGLNYIENPHGEEPSRIKRFYDVLKDTYLGTRTVSVRDYGALWESVGLNKDDVKRLINSVEKTLSDSEQARKIRSVYHQMMTVFFDDTWSND